MKVIFYLLSIVEVGSIDHVLDFGWLDIILESAEVILAKLSLSMGLETLVQRWNLSLVVFSIDSLSSGLSE